MIWTLGQLFSAVKSELAVQLSPIKAALDAIQNKETKIMSDINKIQADEAAELSAIGDLKTAVVTAVGAIQANTQTISDQSKTIADLKAQIAAGNPVTQAQLDALDDSITGNTSIIQTQAAALLAAIAPPTPPPAPVPAG